MADAESLIVEDPAAGLGRWAGLELRHLLALDAIAEHGSFGRAAVHLGYTQSGVSQQIAALERIVGERLIDRPGGSRPVRLTEAGSLMLEHARAVFAQVTAAQADVDALGDGLAGVLRVGAFQSIGARILPSLIQRLTEGEGPDVEFVQTTTDPELFALLRGARVDLSFVMLPPPEGPFNVVELFAEPFVALVPADSPLARRNTPLSVRELDEVPLITARSCRFTGLVNAQLRELGIEPNVVHRSDDNGTILGLVAAGAGTGLVPQLVAESGNEETSIVEIDEQLLPRRIGLAWRSDRHLPRARDTFITAVQETCEALGLRPQR